MGSVLGDSSQRAIQVRIAGLLAGIPDNVPVHTVNRWACLQWKDATCPQKLSTSSVAPRSKAWLG